jgi:hypothetical protein
MKNLKWLSGSVAILFLLASCASTAHVEKADDADFSRYKSFAWMTKDEKGNDRQLGLTEQKIRAAVNRELEKAGWKETKNKPDVLLNYDVLVERNIREVTSPVYSRPYTRLVYNPYTRRYTTIYYPSQFMGYERDGQAVREGTVTITMIDASADRAIWQGWTTGEINGRNMSSKEIQNSVRSIFRKFDLAKN